MISRKRCSADSTLKNPTNYQQMGFETLFRIIMSCKLQTAVLYCIYIYPVNPLNEIRFAEFEEYTHNIIYTTSDSRCSILLNIYLTKEK
jgi:hypothetical protein